MPQVSPMGHHQPPRPAPLPSQAPWSLSEAREGHVLSQGSKSLPKHPAEVRKGAFFFPLEFQSQVRQQASFAQGSEHSLTLSYSQLSSFFLQTIKESYSFFVPLNSHFCSSRKEGIKNLSVVVKRYYQETDFGQTRKLGQKQVWQLVGVTINSCSRLPHRFLYECQSRQACCLALRSGEMTSVDPSESEVGVSHNWGPILCQKKGLCLRNSCSPI